MTAMMYRDPQQGQERTCPVSEGMEAALETGVTVYRQPGEMRPYTRHETLHNLFAQYCTQVGVRRTSRGKMVPVFNNTSAN